MFIKAVSNRLNRSCWCRGSVVVITCNDGYRASTRAGPSPNASKTYTRTCVDEPDIPCILLDTNQANTLCRPISCGVLMLQAHSSSSTRTVELLHDSNPVEVCLFGMR
jgi:hypothetical protein